MAGLGETVFELTRNRVAQAVGQAVGKSRLHLVAPRDSNPGNLRMHVYVPPGLPPNAALVVVLHGCTQTAPGYDAGSGWSQLAERHGFALLYPEQDRTNNPNLCFNWYHPEDTTRDSGEALSIRQMIDQMQRAYGLNPARTYITGLSAGGAMTNIMLATYPESFAGAAILAGLPYGAAAGMPAAFEAMRGNRHRTAREWGDLVRAASPHRGPYPLVQLWHGTADTTVTPANLEALAAQWTDAMGLVAPPETQVEGKITRATWRREGRPALETVLIAGLAHGLPLDTGAADADESVGAAGPFMLEAGIGSTCRIARSWGLLTQAAQARPAADRPTDPGPLGTVANTIRDALRAAGLDWPNLSR